MKTNEQYIVERVEKLEKENEFLRTVVNANEKIVSAFYHNSSIGETGIFSCILAPSNFSKREKADYKTIVDWFRACEDIDKAEEAIGFVDGGEEIAEGERNEDDIGS